MTKEVNYVLLTGPQGGPYGVDPEGYATEGELMRAVTAAEDRGQFCLAYALENPHYVTGGALEETQSDL